MVNFDLVTLNQIISNNGECKDLGIDCKFCPLSDSDRDGGCVRGRMSILKESKRLKSLYEMLIIRKISECHGDCSRVNCFEFYCEQCPVESRSSNGFKCDGGKKTTEIFSECNKILNDSGSLEKCPDNDYLQKINRKIVKKIYECGGECDDLDMKCDNCPLDFYKDQTCNGIIEDILDNCVDYLEDSDPSESSEILKDSGGKYEYPTLDNDVKFWYSPTEDFGPRTVKYSYDDLYNCYDALTKNLNDLKKIIVNLEKENIKNEMD